MPYSDETLSKWSSNEAIILTKFHGDRTKIVKLLLIANFLECALFSSLDFKNKGDTKNAQRKTPEKSHF